MIPGFRTFRSLLIILSLLSLAGCAPVTLTPADGAGQGVSPSATPAPSATAAVPPTAGPAPATTPPTPVPSAAPAASPSSAPAAGVGVIVSSPVAPSTSPPLRSITPQPASGGLPPTPGTNGQITVTLANNGATVKLRAGDRFVLMLGDTYNWEVTPADPAIVSRVINITPVRGSQGVYEARKAGQTKIEASGDPLCRQSQPPCGMPSLLFTLNVVVE